MTYIDQIKRLSVKVNAGSGILVKPFAGNHLFVFTAYHVIKDLDDSEIVISTASDLTEEFSCTVIKSYHSTDTDEDAAIIEIDTTYQVEQLFCVRTTLIIRIFVMLAFLKFEETKMKFEAIL